MSTWPLYVEITGSSIVMTNTFVAVRGSRQPMPSGRGPRTLVLSSKPPSRLVFAASLVKEPCGMKPRKPSKQRERARWSPETETREEMKALLLVRRPLLPPEVELFRTLFGDIYDRYFDDVWRTLVKWGVRGEALTELTQETFKRLWESTVTEGAPDVLLAKLRGLAMGLAMNLGTRGERSPVTDRGPPSSDTEKPAVSGPRLDRIIDAKEVARTLFDALSIEHRGVVSAIILRDLTHEQAAVEMGLKKSTVTTRLAAAIERMRELSNTLLSPSERSVG
jgi:DNA-directed RNA polymerase specialized sigma24 family protein